VKIWVETRTIEQPEFTVSGKFGGSIMFVGYSRALDQWFWLQPYGIEEKIAEPPEIYVDEDWARVHKLAKPRPRREGKAHHIHRGKLPDQLSLDL
jgi:hypothetical protein